MPPAWFVCGHSSSFTKLLSFCSLVNALSQPPESMWFVSFLS
ncbi:unnamed protein product [Arabidopsis lyrata]|nr:unnamed protein product [Arabidopsis lyrata]